jgi:carbonic anhydrase
MPSASHPATCSCCGGLRDRFDRRRFLQLAGGASLAVALPFARSAAAEPYETVLLICNDPRIWRPTMTYMASRKMNGKYRPFAIDGGAVGLVAEQYKDSNKEFWADLSAAVTWNQTNRIIALNHRDCVAAKIAYGLVKTADKLIETEMHRYAMKEFRKKVAERHADLEVEIGLMALDGKVDILK